MSTTYPTTRPVRYGPLIAAGIVMGAGLGGFVDGIALHQIAQWHHMLSAKIPPNDVVSIKVNMLWDGIFHAAVWIMTMLGLWMLWRAGGRADVSWSGKVFVGALLCGWGLFNLIEGTINHQIIGLHHVNEYSSNRLLWDLGFLLSGVLLILGGWLLVRAAKRDESRLEGEG